MKTPKTTPAQPVANDALVRLLQHAYSIYSVDWPIGERMPYLLINFERENCEAMEKLEAMLCKMSGVGAGYSDRKTKKLKCKANGLRPAAEADTGQSNE